MSHLIYKKLYILKNIFFGVRCKSTLILIILKLMMNKHISIFKELKEVVAKLPQWVSSHVPVVKNKKPESPFTQEQYNQSPESFMSMDWDEFAELIYNIFKQRGYSVAEPYENIDLVLEMNNQKTFVQCKQWKEQQVDAVAIIKLYTQMKEEGIRHGIIISSGVFTPEALDFALGKALLLINGADLVQMVEALNDPVSENVQQPELAEEAAEPEMPELEPVCPICSQKMIKRTARKGKNAGNTFWGCSQFPACRGVIQNR